MKNKKIFKLLCLLLVVVFGLIAFNVEKSSASSCSVRIVSPKHGDYIEAGQSIPVRIFIDCPYAYKVDYSLISITSGYKQTQTFAGIIDYGNVNLNAYSGSTVSSVLRNYTNDTISFTVVLYKCISPSNFTGGTCNSWETVSDTVRLNVKKAADPAPSPLNVACYVTPHPAKVGQSVKVYANVSGGTPSYRYSWSGDISGNSSEVYKTFNTEGIYGFTVTVTDSKNQTQSAKCATYVEGTTPTPTTPPPTPPPAPTRYACNWSTYNCLISSYGAYSSLTACLNDCKPTPPPPTPPPAPTRYACNWSTYNCLISSYGEYSSLTACLNDCKPSAPSPTRYTCNWSTHNCQISSIGEYSSLTACLNDCKPSAPPPTRYTCNWSTYNCLISSSGEYTSLNNCLNDCKAPPPAPTRYTCVLSTHNCLISSSGEYSSYNACASECVPPPQRYECNTSTFTCFVTTTGRYSSYTECFHNCKAPISVSLTANPTIINRGQSSTLNWTSANANYCVASTGWSGNKSTVGSELVSPIATTTYTITCYNERGESASDTATVSVREVNPSVTISAHPSTIYKGQTSVLTWSSNNVSSCTASNGWSGSKPTAGNQTVAPLLTTIYTITCLGLNGQNVSASTTVTVLDQESDNVLAITKLGRNLSNGEQNFTKVVRANQGDVVEFYILVSNINSTKYANNTIVLDRLPNGLTYYSGTTKIDNIAHVDGLTITGVNLGVLKPGEKRIITFQAIASQIVGQYTLTNTAEARAENVNTVSDTATVTYSAVLGAATIATGPVETGLLIGTLSLALTSSAWYYLNKTEKGRKLLKEMETKKIQKRIDSLR